MASLRDFGQPKVRDLLTTTKNSVVRPKEKKRREGGEVRCEKRMKGNERSEGKRERSKKLFPPTHPESSDQGSKVLGVLHLVK
jgi:hypothetical protein